jgi:tRNA/rRNA methyltransferase
VIRIVLVRPAQPRNIGAVVRAAANFGAESVRLVAPENWDAEAEREARVASSGGWDHVEVKVHEALKDALPGCEIIAGTTARNREHPAAPKTPAELFDNLAPDANIAIVFGPESQGLSSADLNMCHERVTIPSRPEFPSLNLGQAVLVVLYEFGRNRSPKQSEASLAAPREMQEAWLQKLPATDQSRTTLRNLLYRSGVTEQELAALRQISKT